MGHPTLTVGDVARLARVSVRTLHHYDAIGLLVPSAFTEAGYRLYTHGDVERLHLVRLYRDGGLPLEAIRRVLDDPGFDRATALSEHRDRLLAERDEVDRRVAVIDAILKEETMAPRDLFDGFDPSEHEEEAEARWGQTEAYRESQRRTKRYGPDDWKRIKAEMADIEEQFAAAMARGTAAGDAVVRDIAERARQHIDRWYYPCSRHLHAQVAESYVADPRFAKHYEERAAGLSVFVRDAIRANLAYSPSQTAGA